MLGFNREKKGNRYITLVAFWILALSLLGLVLM